MFTKNLTLAVSLSAILFASSVNAVIGPIKITLNPTEVSSNYFNESDTLAPFSSEIYTEEDIKNSKSSDIYDFLTQNTSLSLAPSSGNRFSQKISARGYGLTVGSHNIIVTLNGRRLNNIDTSGPELNTININDVEKIEITKGTGSVIYGDSAMAGAIHVFTKDDAETKISSSVGNYGLTQTSASVGINQEKIGVNISMDTLSHSGYHVAGPNGNKDKGEQIKSNIGVSYLTDGETEYKFDYDESSSENRYPNYLNLYQFNARPNTNGTEKDYTFREIDSSTFTLKVTRPLTENFTLSRSQSLTNKNSQNTYWYSSPGKSSLLNYDYKTSDYVLNFKNKNLKIVSGLTFFEGLRETPNDNITTKNNSGIFSQLQYNNNDNIYTIGARKETIDYLYNPDADANRIQSGKHKLNAFDIGFNSRINLNTTLFSNYNQAFQAPLIDRFFKSAYPNDGQIFSGFVNPAKSKTINIGLNHLTKKTKTKATLFSSNLTDEMYYFKNTGDTSKNTNIDKSSKYGLEFQNRFVINPKWSTNINYAYTIAKIDEEVEQHTSYNGNTNPMTSKNNITASVSYSFNDNADITITQKYRSSAFAEEDYSNSDSQKQIAYNSTDFNFSYSSNDQLEFNFDIENLFENTYGTWLRKDVIYPGNFTRNIKAELSYKF